MAVVVPEVAVEYAKEVAAAGEQEMVQALLAYGADPALGDGVGVRGLDRCADDLGAEPVPDVIEGSGELAVAVADQSRCPAGTSRERENVVGLPADAGIVSG